MAFFFSFQKKNLIKKVNSFKLFLDTNWLIEVVVVIVTVCDFNEKKKR